MKNIKMIAVKSSNVKCVGYDEENKNIHIELTSGERYMYQDVPKKVFEDLLKATSIGSYINRYLKDSYKLVSENSFYALQKASEPLVEYLKKYYCPHIQIIVSWDFVKVMQEEMGMPIGTAQEVPVQEQLNEDLINAVIEKIMSNDVFIDIILKRLTDKLISATNSRSWSSRIEESFNYASQFMKHS